jgi:hypothetical protein
MTRFLVLPMFAAVLLAGCSTTIRPTIKVIAQNGGTSFLINGSGFSQVSTCATLSYVVQSASGGSTPVPVPPGSVGCNLGTFSLPWTPSQTGCTANTPILVTASDIPTGTLAGAPVFAEILCEAVPCPPEVVPASTNTTMPKYFVKSTGSQAVNAAGPPGYVRAVNPGPDTCVAPGACIPSYPLVPTTSTTNPPTTVSTGWVDGVSTPGAFEQCTYVPPAKLSCPIPPFTSGPTGTAASCATIVAGWNETLVFTCPKSGGCQ